MSEFKFTEEKLKAISKKFDIKIETVNLVHNIFTEVISDVKYQYLAHIIRCMETYFRKRTKNPMFQINCYPIDSKSTLINVGCAQYFPKKLFNVFFDPKMEEKQLRVCLAHELGHLFFIEMVNDRKNDGETFFDVKTLTEPLSSIFGVFIIMDKNDFYNDCKIKFNHHSWEEIVQAFVHLQEKLINQEEFWNK